MSNLSPHEALAGKVYRHRIAYRNRELLERVGEAGAHFVHSFSSTEVANDHGTEPRRARVRKGEVKVGETEVVGAILRVEGDVPWKESS